MPIKPKLPNGISFDCYAVEGGFQAFACAVFDAIRSENLPEPGRWSTHASEGGTGIGAALQSLPPTPKVAGVSPAYIEFETNAGMTGMIQFLPDNRGQPVCQAGLQWTLTSAPDSESNARNFQHKCVSICGTLMKRFDVYSVELRPDSEGYCVPNVPLVTDNSHLAVARAEDATGLYDHPERFWAAGWTIVGEHEGQRLLARNLNLLGGPEYLERIIDNQWAMARAAKPRETGYSAPIVREDETFIFNRGEARLQSVGYDESVQLLEYSCVLGKGEHIQGWEIYALFGIVEKGKSAEGWPVTTIRIVFLERWMAVQEKRPLLDIGCRVWHYDGEGELREIVE